MGVLSVKHSANAGDLLSIFAGLKQLSKETKQKIIVYQRIDMAGQAHIGAHHPFHNKFDLPVCLNQYMFDLIKPLVLAQQWCDDFIEYSGQSFDLDMDKMRSEMYTPMPNYSINRWINFVYPQMICDISKRWLDVPAIRFDIAARYSDKIIVNFTKRFRNHYINYFFFKQYENNILFAGLDEEHEMFCGEWKLNVPKLEIANFLELAEIIDSCRLFIGCQSAAFQIAEGLKIKRVLEVFQQMPNVIPMGANGYEYMHQHAVEYLVSKLYEK